MIESALLNIEKFNSLLQAFMELPEIEQVMEMVKNEADQAKFCILSSEVQQKIVDLEQ